MLNLLVGGQEYSTVEGSPDEGLIMAYVDGELNETGRSYVEKLLSSSPEAREIADMMQSTYSLIRSAYQDEPQTPPALSLVAAKDPSADARVRCSPAKASGTARNVTSTPRAVAESDVRLQGQA